MLFPIAIKAKYNLNAMHDIHLKESFQDFFNHNDDPLLIDSQTSFHIYNTKFYNNKNSFSGGCIFIATQNISLDIQESFFYHNFATIGGAISISSPQSQIFINQTRFQNNFASIGLHMYLQTDKATCNHTTFATDNNYQYTNQNSSVIFVDSSLLLVSNSAFFMKVGLIDVSLNSLFQSCCFFHQEGGNSFFFSNDNPTFDGEICVNLKKAINAKVVNGEIVSDSDYLSIECRRCQIIPTPSQTIHATVQSTEFYISITAILFFVLIAVIGAIVSGFQCKEQPVYFDTSSSSGKDEID